ncbi:MAG: hypothetical protein IIB58_08175 [Planctomycetes bacterium]|nr:hypothetical protein [Planctomycetota bacterium]
MRALGAPALDVLLEILADDSVSLRDRDEIARHILPLGEESRDKRGLQYRYTAIERRQLTEHAGRITDAISTYLGNNPGAQKLSGFVEIVPIDRLPDILELCDDRREYLEIFSRLTHTDFYERGPLNTDNPTSQERAAHYRQVVQEAREWWTQHAEDGYKAWAVACVRRNYAAALQRYQDHPEGNSKRSGYDYKYSPRIGPSTFEALAKQYEQAPIAIKPSLLNQIASTAHPDAAALMAKQLESDAPGVLHAAISGLQKMNASQYTEQIRAVLRTTEDQKLILDALRALINLGKEQALEEIAQWMSHEDINIAFQAQGHLRPYFKTHPGELRDIAVRHPDPEVRKKLHFLIDQAITQQDINEDGDPARSREIVRVIRGFLRSSDPQRRRHGLQLVGQNELVELLPLVVGMLSDKEVVGSVTSVLGSMGIPELSIENAPLFMGYSISLDRKIAAWFYEKFGRKALPLIQKTAFVLPDPKPDLAMRYGPPMPFVGFIKVLIDERAEGVAQQLIEMLQSSPHPELLIPVLGYMDDAVTATFIGEALTGESALSRLTAINMASVRKLTQYADVLFDIAIREPNEEVWSKAKRDYEAGRITYEEYTPTSLDSLSHPTCSCRAAQALVAFGDARAWDAIKHCLLSEYVDKRQNFSAMSWGMTIGDQLRSSAAFGVSISPLAKRYGDEMNAILRREIRGQKRTHVVLPLTAALVYEPSDADLQLFREITSSSDLSQHSRILAAVARSRLDDSTAIPVLRGFLRMKLAGQLHVQWLFHMRPQPNLPRPWAGPASLGFFMSQHSDQPTLELRHGDLATALRRLGDETMTNEVLDVLADERGEFKSESYAILRRLLGTRAYKKAHDRLSRENPEMVPWFQWHELRFDDPQVSRSEASAIIVKRVDNLSLHRAYIRKQNLTEIADHLAAWVEEYLGDESSTVHFILDLLAQLGDPRALSLVAHDPLLLAEMKHYLPDAPPIVPGRFFKYNRVEDALRLQAWYFEHADQLRWDASSRRFRVAHQD